MNHGDHENTERSAAGCVGLATHQPVFRRRRARQAHPVVPSPAFCFLEHGSLDKIVFSVISGFSAVQGARLRGRNCCAAVDPSIVRIRQVRKESLLFLPDMQIFLLAFLDLLNVCHSTGPVLPRPDFAFLCAGLRGQTENRYRVEHGLPPKFPRVS